MNKNNKNTNSEIIKKKKKLIKARNSDLKANYNHKNKTLKPTTTQAKKINPQPQKKNSGEIGKRKKKLRRDR